MKLPKKQIVKELLRRGYAHDVVAASAGCTLCYVRKIDGGFYQPYVHSIPVRMVHGPWSIDAHGNLSREIRGE